MSLQRDQALLFTFTGYLLMLGVGPQVKPRGDTWPTNVGRSVTSSTYWWDKWPVVLVLLETFHLLYVKYQPTGTHNCLHTIQNMTQMTYPIIPCNQTFNWPTLISPKMWIWCPARQDVSIWSSSCLDIVLLDTLQFLNPYYLCTMEYHWCDKLPVEKSSCG